MGVSRLRRRHRRRTSAPPLPSSTTPVPPLPSAAAPVVFMPDPIALRAVRIAGDLEAVDHVARDGVPAAGHEATDPSRAATDSDGQGEGGEGRHRRDRRLVRGRAMASAAGIALASRIAFAQAARPAFGVINRVAPKPGRAAHTARIMQTDGWRPWGDRSGSPPAGRGQGRAACVRRGGVPWRCNGRYLSARLRALISLTPGLLRW